MKKKTFNLFDKINHYGMDNLSWGLVDGVESTAALSERKKMPALKVSISTSTKKMVIICR